jgi:hypothetical protein
MNINLLLAAREAVFKNDIRKGAANIYANPDHAALLPNNLFNFMPNYFYITGLCNFYQCNPIEALRKTSIGIFHDPNGTKM